jgi:uncharacterized protein (DUF2062 family)
MLDAGRIADTTASILHLGGGLYGAWTHIMVGDLGGSILVALTVAACILILAGAVALAEVARVKVRQFARKQERPSLPEPRNKGD